MVSPLNEKIKEIRIRRGLTQYQVARLVEVDDSYITKLEKGRKTASLEFAFKFEHALKIKSGEISDIIIQQIRDRVVRSGGGTK